MNRFSGIFVAALALVLSGCAAFCDLRVETTPRYVGGEKVLASFYVQNVSYQLLGFIPLSSGQTWQEGGIEHADDVEFELFCNSATLDENMKCLDHACDVVGSHRIGCLSHNISEDPFWSFFLCNRRTIKTQCLIFESKNK